MPGGRCQRIGETGQLSHGEQSRLFIARARLQRSDVIVLDESLAALDPRDHGADPALLGRPRPASSSSRARDYSASPVGGSGSGGIFATGWFAAGSRDSSMIRAPSIKRCVVDTLTRSEPSTRHITNSNSPAPQV